MPRQPTTVRTIVEPKRAMVASASYMIAGAASRNYRRAESWQERCWYYRDTIGELRYASNWFANALSRAILKPAKYEADGTLVPIESGPAFDILQEILGGTGAQSPMMKAMGSHYFIVGEWYIVGRAAQDFDDTDDDRVWEVVSSSELKKKGTNWWIDLGGGEKIELTDDDDIIRMINPHPRNRSMPDSPVRAVLSSLAEIESLTLHVQSQVQSRLAGGGVFFISNETTFATPNEDNDGATMADGADPFMVALARTMAAARANPGAPEGFMPIIARVPGDQVDKQNWVTFWSELDAETQGMRDAAIRRTALGLDLPPEVLLGTADVNHWGSWQIEESTIKAHIEPALEVIASAMTVVLRVAADDPDIVTIFDTSALRLRPNRSKEALELYDRGQIDAEALRRETGFNEADEPDDDEKADWLLRKVASGSATPEMVAQALTILGVPMTAAPSDVMREERPDPTLEDHPVRDLPPERVPADAERASLEATCDVLVYRALERSGNRLKNLTTSRPEGVVAEEMHLYVKATPINVNHCMKDAWAPLPRLLAHTTYSPEKIERALDSYTRGLLSGQQRHEREAMMRFIDAALEAVPA